MSAVLGTQQATATDVNSRLEFFKKLQAVTNKIHATTNIDEKMDGIEKVLSGLTDIKQVRQVCIK
jgi:hypothetical protein